MGEVKGKVAYMIDWIGLDWIGLEKGRKGEEFENPNWIGLYSD